MSEFRIFCIGFCVGSAGGATLANHALLGFPYGVPESLLLLGATFGCLAVIFFGGRK